MIERILFVCYILTFSQLYQLVTLVESTYATSAKCDDEKCRNVRGFWLSICLASICSLPLRSDTVVTDDPLISHLSPCPSKCNADDLNMTDYLQCIRNQCPSDDSLLDRNTDQDQSRKLSIFDPEQSSSVLTGDGDQFLSSKRVQNDSLKSCLAACSVYALKNPRSSTTYCVNRFCAKLKHTRGLSSYIDKRWNERVDCMDIHCRQHANDTKSYVQCGDEYCEQ